MNNPKPLSFPKVPEVLYKYTTVKNTLLALRHNKVYIPHRLKFNDPFDGRMVPDYFAIKKRKEAVEYFENTESRIESKNNCIESHSKQIKKEEARDAREQLIKDDKYAGEASLEVVSLYDKYVNPAIYSFTTKKNSLPMWAHYANSHKGCCLIFNMDGHDYHQSVNQGKPCLKPCFPFPFINEIEYSKEFPTLGVDWYDRPHLLYASGSAYMTKSEEWAYEEEWRAIIYDMRSVDLSTSKDIAWTERMTGPGEYKLDDGLLSGVILGYKISASNKKSIIGAARKRGIEISIAKLEMYKYGMHLEPPSS